MNESTIFCTAASDGVDCIAEAAMTTPVPLCDEHRIQVALLVVPDLLTASLRQAKGGLRPVALAPTERVAVIAGAQPKHVATCMGGVHGPIVYFAENGDRVKIGFSTNLRNRVRTLSLQEKDVALVLQGGLTLEKALHDTYAKERIDSTEWFVKSERIGAFIEAKRAIFDGARGQAEVRRRVKPARIAAPTDGARRSASQWALLAAPLYRQFATDHDGATPAAPVLAGLLCRAYPNLDIPGSERWARNVRSAVEVLIKQDG